MTTEVTTTEVTGAPAGQPAAVAAAATAPVTATTPPAQSASAQPVAGVAGESPAFGEAFEYAPSGDDKLDLVLGFLGRNGMSDKHPAVQAAMGGDFDMLRAALAEKGIQGWEAHIALAQQFYETHTASEREKQEATGALCVAAAGSREEWDAVLEWASTNAEPTEKQAANDALAAGGIMAEAMAHFLVNGYRNSSGVTSPPQRSAVRSDAAANTAQPFSPLDQRSYGREVHALRERLGPSFESSPDYRQLQQRRAAWRG
ncbi:hypothetical protein AB870_03550 [Pandoraea faecigallinarum]|uniref:Scaffolding-like protein n=1 Tax=Pandoraea faecigallinarum TaxID=656179 RepID=A0A173GZY3_9BURK|nr:hypothetical protein [Pandoraea faecigallinarum]ANI21762.1 hypothetical protein AB870_03550 [Pandoraea faecigallinarum]